MTQSNRSGARMLPLLAAVVSLFSLTPATSQAQGQYPTNITYSAPITITQGGTYTGNFRSTDSNTPCIRIQTTQPVTITGCVLVGAGDLIDAKNGGSTLVITNNKGYGIQQSVDNKRHGRFVEVNTGRSVRIENNYFEHTSGIAAYQWSGDGSASQTLTVRYNQAKNIDGRYRNGGGEYVQFCGMNQVRNVGNIEIAWNQVINEPNNSLVEDNINFYNSGGVQQSVARVHDNFIKGAYPYPANGNTFTGTGMTTDGDGSSASTTAAFIEAYNNQFISTCNAAMNIAAGHDVYYHDNRMITAGQMPDGSAMNANYAATAVFNAYQQPGSVFYNNRIQNNTIGFVKNGYNVPFPNRHDLSTGACSTCSGTTHLPNPITLQTEADEMTRWQQKLQQNNIALGAGGTNTGGTSTPTPTPAPTPAPAPAPVDPTNATFVRAINVNGGATTIDSRAWEAGGSATGFQVNGNTFSNQGITLNPATDAARADMIRSSAYSNALTANVTVSNGAYVVYAYVWEDNNAETFSLALEGQTVQSNYNSGSAGTWKRLGPFTANVADGNLTLTSTGGTVNLSGIEIWKANTATQNQAPTVSLAAASSSVTVNSALALTATAADADGSVAKVEFFNGSTKLGEDTSAPYQLSWTPTAAGSVSLTAKATDNAGASTTSAAVAVTVNPATVATPSPTFTGPANSTFFRAINIGGSAVTLDGNSWEASAGAANVQLSGMVFSNTSTTLQPSADAARASMLTTAIGGTNVGATVSNVPNGTYSVYAYIWEDNNPETTNIVLEGQTVQSNYNTGSAGTWKRLGPFTTNITDGNIVLATSGGHPNLSGIEIWKANTATQNQAPTVSLAAASSSVTVNSALALTATAADADGSVAKVEFFNGSTKLGEDTSAPYQLSWTPTAAGSVSLTAKATDNAGASTTSAAVAVTVNPTTVATATFYRAVNLNGSATTLDGNTWQGSTAANYTTNGTPFANQGITLNPATTTANAQMIRSSVYGRNLSFSMTSVPNGTYDVYAYVWEDNAAQTVSIALNGQTVLSNYNTGPAGNWKKIGPFTTTVSNGTLTLTSSGGDLNLSGVEVWKKSTGTAFQLLNPFQPQATTLATVLAPAAGTPAGVSVVRPQLVTTLPAASRQRAIPRQS
ncbi:Ig-like domain-containing protein [Hymenobacter pini]|uniref:Ig-like domain-containing protein n=1 Tax=Hymenobacter pini TaxID=2880879 RepID=UPI001CF4927C|nr:Ig-like domain-containing protein [Hymenobacter pini]MCA8829550.1 Ig-like domain-containing protein [Hymenobacter pini]